jgi:hypothetical protein
MRPWAGTLRGRIPSDRADTAVRPETLSVCPDPAGSSSRDPPGQRLRLVLFGRRGRFLPGPPPSDTRIVLVG